MAKEQPPKTELGRALREARKRLRYSQDALGNEISVSGALVSRWEMGDVKPTLDSLSRFADLAGRTENERDDIYNTWLRLAGYRGIKPDDPLQETSAPDSEAATLEGAMARAIIDGERDPGRRIDLVLRLREWAMQRPEAAAGSGPNHDPAPTRPAPPAAPDSQDSPDTQP